MLLRELPERLRGVPDRTDSRREIETAKASTSQLRALMKRQGLLLDLLRRELDAFAKLLFNWWAEYFRQLHALSDALIDLPSGERSFDNSVAELSIKIDAVTAKINQLKSRLRYLNHLEKMEEQCLGEEARRCAISTEDIIFGILMARCGHLVCQK